MGKSLRSKVKRRWRKLKRGYLDQILTKPHLEDLKYKLEAGVAGLEYRKEQPKNAFLFPDDPTAEIPQFKPQKIIDLRSTSIPGSGRQYSGASRKFHNETNKIQENQEEMEQQPEVIKLDRNLIKKKKKPGKNRKTIVF